MKRLAGVLPLLLALLLSSPAPAAEEPLRIGVIPFYAPERIWSLYAPFVDYLKEKTGLPWKLEVYPDHDALIEAVSRGELSVAFLGPVPAARAMDRVPLRPVAVALGADGRPYYRSVVVTTDPGVKGLAGLKGKPFGYFKGSTAAHVVPLKMLAEAGVAASDVRLVSLSGQDRILDALFRREIAAAGIKESLFRKTRGNEFRRIASSGPLPNFAFYSSSYLPASTERKFLKALRSFSPGTSASDRAAAASWDDEVKHGFVAPPRGFEASVEALGRLFELFGK